MSSGPPLTLQNGRYVLRRQLGSGSFGDVWLARDIAQAVDVAIKLVGPHVTVDEVLLEAQLLTRLREHDRVATIMTVQIDVAGSFIVMEYLPRGSVEDRLSGAGVSLVEAVRWSREALDALAHAHELGVLHRDVKPGNFLLDQDERAVLSDFGIAEDTMRNLLANSAVYGLHAAPELLSGGSSSVRTDIFAMGCTLYRLVTATYPFANTAEIVAGPPRDVHLLNPQVPLALTRIIRKALASNPADRYQTAREMLEALIPCRVFHGWTRITNPQAIATWRSDITPSGTYQVDVTQTRGGQFRVTARKDRGSGFRRFTERDFQTEAGARAEMRKMLVRVVQGDLP
jgi:serine/threonine protein kinase